MVATNTEICAGATYVQLRQTSSGEEYLEYFKRQTKTRTGENPRDVRKVKPKMFAVPSTSSEKDPVAVYKFYAEKRPKEMDVDEAPFYLAINNCRKDSSKPWFKKSAVGVNTLNSLMKRMADKAGFGPNLKNHSGRKTMMQTLTDNNIPPTDIIQLSGHKNLQSVTNYSTVSQSQQMKMSRALSGLATAKEGGSSNDFHQTVSLPLADNKSTRQNQQKMQQQQGAISLLSGALIHGGQTNISVNSLNQSPVAESESPIRYKRIRLIESDSD